MWTETEPFTTAEACMEAQDTVAERISRDGFAGSGKFDFEELTVTSDIVFRVGEGTDGLNPELGGAMAYAFPDESGITISFAPPGTSGSTYSPGPGWLQFGIRHDEEPGTVSLVFLGAGGWAYPGDLEPGTARAYYDSELADVNGSVTLLRNTYGTSGGDEVQLQFEVDTEGMKVLLPDGTRYEATGRANVSGRTRQTPLDPGGGPDDPGPTGGSGGSAGSGGGSGSGGAAGSGGSTGGTAVCDSSYSETRLTDGQVMPFCQLAYAELCAGNDSGVKSACDTLEGFAAFTTDGSNPKDKCKYCNGQ
jgi:hypothetical protein